MSRAQRPGGAVLENILLVGLFVACLLGWSRVRFAHEQRAIEDLAPIVASYLWELDLSQAWQGSRVILEAEGYDRLTILDANGRVFLDMTPTSPSTVERSLRAIGLMPAAVHLAPLVHSRAPGEVERIGTLQVEHYVTDLFVYVQLGALLLAVGLFRRGQRQRRALEDEAQRLALVEAEATKIQAEARLALRERQLEEKRNLEALGRLAAGVAHDLNNVLTVVFASSELARDLTENPVARSQNDLVISAAERASALTRQLLAFGRRQVMEPRVLDLNDVITAFRPILERAVGDEVRLGVDLDPDLGNIEADPAQIEQVLLNLAVNARDAIDGTGLVEVVTRNVDGPGAVPGGADLPPGRWVALAVRDTGSGMDDETLQRAFEPFFTTKGEGEGTGLGLATVYGIVRQSKGELTVASRLGEGTVFTVGLPR
ncbi:MAG: hypothetical protein KC457_32600, partial [Myxococcales bacterium]|nr:hypothetical protein [Myxococcales bacterium]